MNLVIDTNIFMSALIKDAVTRKIITQSGWRFYYPLDALEEIEKYQELIREKAKLSENEYLALLQILSNYIVFISSESLQNHLKEAEAIMSSIDSKDVIFIATALATDNEGIWTDDLHFEKQKRFNIKKTEDVLLIFRAMQENIWKVLV